MAFHKTCYQDEIELIMIPDSRKQYIFIETMRNPVTRSNSLPLAYGNNISSRGGQDPQAWVNQKK